MYLYIKIFHDKKVWKDKNTKKNIRKKQKNYRQNLKNTNLIAL